MAHIYKGLECAHQRQKQNQTLARILLEEKTDTNNNTRHTGLGFRV